METPLSQVRSKPTTITTHNKLTVNARYHNTHNKAWIPARTSQQHDNKSTTSRLVCDHYITFTPQHIYNKMTYMETRLYCTSLDLVLRRYWFLWPPDRVSKQPQDVIQFDMYCISVVFELKAPIQSPLQGI